jgi:hypothetical protein
LLGTLKYILARINVPENYDVRKPSGPGDTGCDNIYFNVEFFYAHGFTWKFTQG